MLRIESIQRGPQRFMEEAAATKPHARVASIHVERESVARHLRAAREESAANDREGARALGWLGTIFGGMLIGTAIGSPIGGASSGRDQGSSASEQPAMTIEDARHGRVRRDFRI